jgi:hypothetical protein
MLIFVAGKLIAEHGSLSCLLKKYHWRKKGVLCGDYQANSKLLATFQQRANVIPPLQEIVKLFVDVLRWGGCNTSLSPRDCQGIWDYVVGQNGLRGKGVPKLGSGISKIASVISGVPGAVLNEQVIIDSRVATSIISRVSDGINGYVMSQSAVQARWTGIGVFNCARVKRARTISNLISWPSGYGKWSYQIGMSRFVADLANHINNNLQLPGYSHPCNAQWTLREVEMMLFVDGK